MENYENGGIVMVKVDIISGFLGAGKTTLIKHLLAHVYAGENVVLIENEFGEIGIDGGFLKEAGIEIREMNSGCICCSLVGDFATSLKEVVTRYNPDRILIEPSGVGKLSDVIKAVENVKDELELEICYKVAVIDVTKCKMYLKNFGEFYKNQIESASTVIFSRTDIAKVEKVEEALELVKSLNEEAAVITTPVQELDDEILINALKNEGAAKDLIHEEECCCGHHHGHHHHHHEDGEECCCGHHHDEEHEHHHHHHHEDGEECCCGHHHDEEHEHHHHHHEDGEECCCGHHYDEKHEHHHHHHHHHADEVFTSWGKETPHKFTREQIEEVLKTFCETDDYGTILRAKGMVEDVNGSWIYFDMVPGEYELRDGEPDYTGRLCVIGTDIDGHRLEELFGIA